MSVITISRQIGSGAEEVARLVCERLGYAYFDKNFLVDEAIKMGLSESEIVELSEETYKAKTFLENLFSPGARTVASVAIRRRNETGIEKKYIRHLDELDCIDMIRTVIEATYRRGNIVIVGRGGQVILQKKPDVLHVRLIAPLEVRIQRIMGQEGMDADKARQYIQERDKATFEYLERFFKVQWDDPTLYNLTINTGEHNYIGAAATIIHAVEQLGVREAV
jgi:cytidylate kinase